MERKWLPTKTECSHAPPVDVTQKTCSAGLRAAFMLHSCFMRWCVAVHSTLENIQNQSESYCHTVLGWRGGDDVVMHVRGGGLMERLEILSHTRKA